MEIGEEVCKKMGGELPLPRNDKENDDYFKAFTGMGKTIKGVVLGLTDKVDEGKFLDKNGKAPVYTNWNKGQPKADGDYVQMAVGYTHTNLVPTKWNDVFGTFTGYDVVCETSGNSNRKTNLKLCFKSKRRY